MRMDFIVRFGPQPGKAGEVRDALLAVVGLTREERGCLKIQVFESIGDPVHFAIHSEWTDEAAFDVTRGLRTRCGFSRRGQTVAHASGGRASDEASRAARALGRGCPRRWRGTSESWGRNEPAPALVGLLGRMLAASRFVAAGRAITASLRAESTGCQNQHHRKAQ